MNTCPFLCARFVRVYFVVDKSDPCALTFALRIIVKQNNVGVITFR